MGLARQVHRWRCRKAPQTAFTIFGESLRQCHNNGREIGLRSARRKGRDGTCGEAELSSEPGESVPFDLVRRWRRTPSRQLRVIHGDKRVRNDGCERHAGVEETE